MSEFWCSWWYDLIISWFWITLLLRLFTRWITFLVSIIARNTLLFFKVKMRFVHLSTWAILFWVYWGSVQLGRWRLSERVSPMMEGMTHDGAVFLCFDINFYDHWMDTDVLWKKGFRCVGKDLKTHVIDRKAKLYNIPDIHLKLLI